MSVKTDILLLEFIILMMDYLSVYFKENVSITIGHNLHFLLVKN